MIIGIPVALAICLVSQLLVARLFGRSLFGEPSLFRGGLARAGLAFVAGPLVVYVVAAALFFAFEIANGEQVSSLEVEPVAGLPAERAGVLAGDRVVSVSGRPIERWEQVPEAVRERGDEPLELVVDRDGRPVSFSIQPEGGKIGLLTRTVHRELSLPEAAARALPRPFAVNAAVAGFVVSGSPSAVAGPVAIVRQTSAAVTPRFAFTALLGMALASSLLPAIVLSAALFGVLWLVRRRAA